MSTRLALDEAGRLNLPEELRQELKLGPGDSLELAREGDRIVLSPVRPAPMLRKKQGVWVYSSGQGTDVSLTDLIDRARDQRTTDLIR